MNKTKQINLNCPKLTKIDQNCPKLTFCSFQLQAPDVDIKDMNHGLMVRAFNYLFEKIQSLNNEDEFCKVKASYLEIYNEKTIDLLNQGSKRMNLPLRWNKQNQAFYVENLFVFSCTDTQDLVNILVEGMDFHFWSILGQF